LYPSLGEGILVSSGRSCLCCFVMYPMVDPSTDFSIFSWNVCGLNNRAKQDEVQQVIQIHMTTTITWDMLL
jgi:hypothetical protein